jgi:tripartite-type tricarboxylate transporter receptor subunit TctC
MKEFLAYAKKNGSALNFGSVGNGSLSHLTGEYFNETAGLKLHACPYNGGAPMMTAFGGGQLQAAFVTGLDGASHAAGRQGQVPRRGLAARGREVVPGLPAIAEEVPGFRSVAWFGVLAPARRSGCHRGQVARGGAEYAVSAPRGAARCSPTATSKPAAARREELDKIIRDEMAQWGEVVKRSNVRMD